MLITDNQMAPGKFYKWFSHPQVTLMHPSNSIFTLPTWPRILNTAPNSKGWPHCEMPVDQVFGFQNRVFAFQNHVFEF